MPPQTPRFPALIAAGALALLAAAPARAAEVTVVDGERVVKHEDPLVPPRSASDIGPPPARTTLVAVAAARSNKGPRAVRRALRRALRSRAIGRARYRSYVRTYRRARSVRRRLRGARRTQLSYVIGSLERMGLSGRLAASRLPALFFQLERNTVYWASLPYPAAGDRLTFRGSEVLFQYFPGRGLQIHPLATFKKANLMHGACKGDVQAPCRRGGLRRLLDEMSACAVQRGNRFRAWEYLFHFGGGAPPWMSGMAQATGIQALARASQLLGEPRYIGVARAALGAFETPPPVGVRTGGPGGGPHYLQYSFNRRLYIFNAFLQSLIGLYDFGVIAGDGRATRLFRAGEPEARYELPASDVGDWSRYSYRGREATREYHELLREFLQSLCNRRLGGPYCTYARRYRGYQTDPPELVLNGPAAAREDEWTRVTFTLSKLSAVEIFITKGEKLSLHRVATFRRGRRSFAWRPRSSGSFDVRVAAKELRTGRGLKDRDSGTVEVE